MAVRIWSVNLAARSSLGGESATLLTLQVDMYGKQHTDGTEGSSLDAALESGTLRSPSCSPVVWKA